MYERLRYRSAGESHGPAVTVLLEGVPRGMELDLAAIDAELSRRQGGAGRGGRQRIEEDRVTVTAGLRRGVTIGSPICLVVENRDHTIDALPEPTRPRPGHADLAGCYRYLDHDIRGTLERASARETAGRVAAGAVAKQLLQAVGTEVFGFVRRVGGVALPARVPGRDLFSQLHEYKVNRDRSRLFTLDREVDRAMLAAVRAAGKAGDTLGGQVEVHAAPVLPGVGGCLQWDERLDGRLAGALVSIPAFKAAEIGLGVGAGRLPGSKVHDEIHAARDGLPQRRSNRAGGLEGGMTNGAPVVVRGTMKPISTLRRRLRSVDVRDGSAAAAGFERSDVCAVAAASVIAESVVALVLADALLVRVGGESLDEFVERHRAIEARQRGLLGSHGSPLAQDSENPPR